VIQEASPELIDAAMHMLRHLDDPFALRRNILAAPLFAGVRSERSPRRAFARQLQRLRSIVESAAQALRNDEQAGDAVVRERQFEILRRCDLQREPRERVMQDLAISRRQFYRDRSSACAYIATHVERELSKVDRSPGFAVDVFTAAHERARGLRYVGELDRSAAALRDIIAQPISARKRVVAWSTLIDLLNDDSRGEESANELSEMHGFALSHSPSSPLGEQLHQLTALQEASVLWALGEERKALDADQATAAQLSRLGRCTDELLLGAAVKAHLSRAQRAFLVGDYGGSHNAIISAGELIDRCEHLPLAHRLQYLLLDGDRKIFSPSEIRDARGPLAEVAKTAQFAGNYEYLSIALGDMALLEQTYADLDGAQRYGRESLQLAEHAPRGVRGHMLLNCSEIASERGQSNDSIDLARKAQECFPEHGLGASVSLYHIARGLIASRDYSGARNSAEKLRQNAMRGDNRRLLGSGLRLLAQAYHGLGDATAACEHIDGAISLLERFGHPFALRAAYANSAKITGRAEHKRMATQIEASFQLSA
jgi:hypothetical protein